MPHTRLCCRGWSGAAGEEGDAEDDEDEEDEEDEDEDQDDDEDLDDSSSEGSSVYSTMEWTQLLGQDQLQCGCNEVEQVLSTSENGCYVMPVLRATGCYLGEGGQSATRLQMPAFNGGRQSCQAVVHPDCAVSAHVWPASHCATPFRTQSEAMSACMGQNFGSCTCVEPVEHHSKQQKQRHFSKSSPWVKLPQFVLYTLINIVGSSL